jgi:hypothetical protein
MLRPTLISLSLFACNSFDGQSQGVEPSASSFIIVDNTYAVDTIELEQKSNLEPVVLDIPELNLEVIEVDPSSNAAEGTTDEIHIVQTTEELSPYSPFLQELRAERMLSVFAISSLPGEMLKEVQIEHELTVLFAQDAELYTSELLQAVVLASNNNAELVFIPLRSEDMPAIIFEGIAFGQSTGTRFFDAQGNLL